MGGGDGRGVGAHQRTDDEPQGTDQQRPGEMLAPFGRAVCRHGVAKLRVLHHLQFGETDVEPVEVSGEVTEDNERHDPSGDLAIHTTLLAACAVVWMVVSATTASVIFDIHSSSF